MINVWMVLVVLLVVIGIGMAWEAMHMCSREGCQEWTPETGPARLCPVHRSELISTLERRWAGRQTGGRAA